MCVVSNLSRRHMLKLWKIGCDQILKTITIIEFVAHAQLHGLSFVQKYRHFPLQPGFVRWNKPQLHRDLPEELERNDPIPAEQLSAPQPEPSSTATPVPQPETDSTATPARQPEPSSTVTPAQQPEPSEHQPDSQNRVLLQHQLRLSQGQETIMYRLLILFRFQKLVHERLQRSSKIQILQ